MVFRSNRPIALPNQVSCVRFKAFWKIFILVYLSL
jgi:hypothetical protein